MENILKGITQLDQRCKYSKNKKMDWEKSVQTTPPIKWIKIKFDGAAKGNPGLVGCGSISKDYNGNFIAANASPLGMQNNHMAEAMRAYFGLQLANRLNFKKIWLEGDSMNIINCLKGHINPLWIIENIISKMKDIIANFTKADISHEYHESNAMVDSLANIGVKANEIIIWDNMADLKEDTKLKIHYD